MKAWIGAGAGAEVSFQLSEVPTPKPGAGELLVTSIDRDGTRAGYDVALLSAITSRVRTPVIASGGAGRLEHLVEAVRDGGASAVLAASIFHFGVFTLAQARTALARAGAHVRALDG